MKTGPIYFGVLTQMEDFKQFNFFLDFRTKEDLQAQIKRMTWAHPIKLTEDVNTRDWHVQRRFERRLRLLQIPPDLRGKTVLDIGAWDGFFSFECERRGAERVLAIDTFAWDTNGMDSFLLAHKAFNSKVEYRRMDVHELDPGEIGKFDVVLFLGVFYHCVNPLVALQRIADVCRDLLICETHCLIPFMHEKYPLVPFFPGDEKANEPGQTDKENPYQFCSIPTLEGLKQMLKAAGANRLEIKYTPSFHALKKLKALLTNRPQSGRAIVHAYFNQSQNKVLSEKKISESGNRKGENKQ